MSANISSPSTARIKKVKLSNEIVNNSAVLQDDNELQGLSLEAGGVYRLEVLIMYTSATAQDFQSRLTFSESDVEYAGMTCCLSTALATTGSYVNSNSSAASTTTVSTGGDAADICVLSMSMIVYVPTSCTVKFEWAQAVAAASDTTVLAGSMMCAERIN